jgi:hypothetical protein
MKLLAPTHPGFSISQVVDICHVPVATRMGKQAAIENLSQHAILSPARLSARCPRLNCKTPFRSQPPSPMIRDSGVGKTGVSHPRHVADISA